MLWNIDANDISPIKTHGKVYYTLLIYLHTEETFSMMKSAIGTRTFDFY